VTKLYASDHEVNHSATYNSKNQNLFNPLLATTNLFTPMLDTVSLTKCLVHKNATTTSRRTATHIPSQYTLNPPLFEKTTNFPDLTSFVAAKSDHKFTINPFKQALHPKWVSKKQSFFVDTRAVLGGNYDVYVRRSQTPTSNYEVNTAFSPSFKDNKSPNLFFLGPNRAPRDLGALLTGSNSHNFTPLSNKNLTLLAAIGGNQSKSSLGSTYSLSLLDWADTALSTRLSLNSSAGSQYRAPLPSINPHFNEYSHDQADHFSGGRATAPMLSSKDESAPNHLFSTYWSSYWAYTNSRAG